jgi:beta-lactamase regulating signal transducer with metallopeptidase domain
VLWLFVLIKLVTPPLWQLPVSLQNLPIQAGGVTALEFTPEKYSPPVSESRAANQAPLEPVDEQPFDLVPALETSETTPPPSLFDAKATILSSAAQRSALAFPWKETLAYSWLAGSLLVIGLTILRLTAFIRCLRRLQPAQANMQKLVQELSQRLGLRTAPQLGIAPMRMAPLVWGWGFRPRVIIPSELWETLDQEQRTMLLMHELAHLKRGDHWVRLLEILVRGVYWWHPVVWLAGREMREAEEQCCDAWAVWALPHAAKSYARAIVDTVDFLARRSVPLPVGASGIGQVQDLRRRLIMIMRGTTPRNLSGTALAGLVVLGGLLILLGPTFGQQQSSPEVVSADEPVPALIPRSSVLAQGVRFTDPFADDEIARLRQQEENLRRAMEAVARSLEQTKRQLDSIEGAPRPEPRIAPAALPRRSAAPATPPEPQSQPRPAAAARSADFQPRQRFNREQPVEERLSRLEERMGQIADDLQALRRDMRPSNPPTRSVRPPKPSAVQASPDQPTLPRKQPRPAAAPIGIPPLPPSADQVPPGEPVEPEPTLAPAVRPTAAPPTIAPVGPRRPANRTPPSTAELPITPASPRPATRPAAISTPVSPVPPRPASRSVDEKPENPLGERP